MSEDGVLARGRAAAERRMRDTVRLHRPGPPVFDQETGTTVPGPSVELYRGRARVRAPQAAGREVVTGERMAVLREYIVHLPWSAVLPAGARVVPGDVAAVLASPDERLAGLSLYVVSVDYGAQATAWRLRTEDRS